MGAPPPSIENANECLAVIGGARGFNIYILGSIKQDYVAEG